MGHLVSEEQVFGPGRPAAAREAIFELERALIAREEAGGGWAPEPYHLRVVAARERREMYWGYGSG